MTQVVMELSPQGRLWPRDVEHLHRVLGGDSRSEEMILRFIAERYRANNLFGLPPKVAEAALKRPADFIRAAKQHCEPELLF
jgi:hypothetical protein